MQYIGQSPTRFRSRSSFGHKTDCKMDAPIDDSTKRTVQKIPLLTTRAGPRDGEEWTKRLKEEYLALIQVRTDES
jgi:hypothetical protein